MGDIDILTGKPIKKNPRKKPRQRDRDRIAYDKQKGRCWGRGKKCPEVFVTTKKRRRVSFHIHHKDGNRSNDNPTNFIALCPTCHKIADDKNVAKENKPKKKKSSDLDSFNSFVGEI